jgi:hypothetical protein
VSREINTRTVGPDLYKRRKPVIALAIVVLIVIDSARFHLLHHLLGHDSTAVVWAVFLAAIIRIAWWAKGRPWSR